MKDIGITHAIFDMVKDENSRQVTKWGIQDKSLFEWLAWATGELGELAEAMDDWFNHEGERDAIVMEAVQLATLVLKIATAFDSEEKQ